MTIICSLYSYMFLYMIGCLSLCWYTIGEDLGLQRPSHYVQYQYPYEPKYVLVGYQNDPAQ